jgi:hypothetical protein
MATLKETALAFEPKQTLNIADLDKVPVDIQVYEGEGNDAEGKPFSYKYAKLNNKEYRIPNSVIEEIQKILNLKPTIEFVKVTKSGSGLATRYKVSPL